jgi:hypothetical protein
MSPRRCLDLEIRVEVLSFRRGMVSSEFSAPPRNFTVSTEERIRALVGGPPAYMRRRRKIEDLEEAIISAARAHERETRAPLDPAALPAPLARALASLVELVETHNRYYPIEANLPIDVATGEPLELGRPWRPMPLPTLAMLLTNPPARVPPSR